MNFIQETRVQWPLGRKALFPVFDVSCVLYSLQWGATTHIQRDVLVGGHKKIYSSR